MLKWLSEGKTVMIKLRALMRLEEEEEEEEDEVDGGEEEQKEEVK